MSTFAITCLVASFLIFSTYIGTIYYKYKPSCISESYYLIKHKSIFTIWIIIVAFLLFPAWVEISPVNFQFLPFLSAIALGSVGLNPRYLESERTAHIVSTAVSVILSLIWNLVAGIYFVPILLGIVLIILYVSKVKNILLWTECLAFLNIYLSIII